jgi:hypothetical protein
VDARLPAFCSQIGKRWYEIEEHVELESSIPSLADSVMQVRCDPIPNPTPAPAQSLACIYLCVLPVQVNTAIELCQRLRDNLTALNVKAA